MEVTGTIKKVGVTQTFGSNGFRKRELVITTDEQYPQSLLVEFYQDKCDILNNYKEGQYVRIGVNLRGREWTNREGKTVYFNTIQGWRIEKTQTAQIDPPEAIEDKPNDDFDLPF